MALVLSLMRTPQAEATEQDMKLPRRKTPPRKLAADVPTLPPVVEPDPAPSECGTCGEPLAHTGAVCDCRKA